MTDAESVVGDALEQVLPESITSSSFDPVSPPAHHEKPWWGRPIAEVRWQAELARLLVDPVYAGLYIQKRINRLGRRFTRR